MSRLLREVHPPQEVLEARVGAADKPVQTITSAARQLVRCSVLLYGGHKPSPARQAVSLPAVLTP